MSTPEHNHASPESPFLSDYPEWNNLVAHDMLASVEAGHSQDAYVEFRRTLCSLYALDTLYVHADPNHEEITAADLAYDHIGYDSDEQAYEAFTAGQAAANKLSIASFLELQHFAGQAVPDARAYRRLQYLMLISDAFKNPELMHAVDLDQGANHDLALVRMFSPEYATQRERYFPSFSDPEKFDDEDRAELLTDIKLMEFNFPGWAQSQASVGHLEALPEDLPLIVKRRFLLHGILDIMGVMGNKSLTSALAYTQSTHDMLMHGVQALTIELEESAFPLPGMQMGPEIREKLYLAMRAEYYGVPLNEYEATMRPLDLSTFLVEHHEIATFALKNHRMSELLTQVRLANMCRYSTPEQFAQLRAAYHEVPEDQTRMVLSLLSLTGDNLEFDYGPSYVREILGNTKESIKQGLLVLDHTLRELQHTSNQLFWQRMSGEPIVDAPAVPERTQVMVLLRELASKSKDPDFDFSNYDLIIDYNVDDNSLRPRLAAKTAQQARDEDWS